MAERTGIKGLPEKPDRKFWDQFIIDVIERNI